LEFYLFSAELEFGNDQKVGAVKKYSFSFGFVRFKQFLVHFLPTSARVARFFIGTAYQKEELIYQMNTIYGQQIYPVACHN
jgi:hypothetical protein